MRTRHSVLTAALRGDNPGERRRPERLSNLPRGPAGRGGSRAQAGLPRPRTHTGLLLARWLSWTIISKGHPGKENGSCELCRLVLHADQAADVEFSPGTPTCKKTSQRRHWSLIWGPSPQAHSWNNNSASKALCPVQQCP